MVDISASYQIPFGDLLQWHPHDRQVAIAHRAYQAEECPECGVHPSVWNSKLGGHRNAIVPEWVFCRVCELIAQARAAGPPADTKEAPGWRLSLRHHNHPD